MAFQSLYRRYRPKRFEEVRGQEHVMRALRNAVREGTVSHAYLFSGPRGTGKTSSARILAKALNCEAPQDGEPCGTCDSCVSVEAGRSLDVTELDAASNNGVDAMRDLVSKVALGTGGRAKVYILDEVHMLSAAASNALLKTLEEPPAHVTFVLATTDPQKVLPTIRSRTQPFEFRLLPSPVLDEHLRWVAADAGLTVTDDAIALAVRRGKGSARDSLSALDQIVAAGTEGDDDTSLEELTEALCERDTGRALAAVALACDAGRDARHLTETLLGHLRDALLGVLAPEVLTLSDDAIAAIADQGRRLGPPAITKALDALGEALLAMREAPDPRICLEVALVRVTRPDLDTSLGALVERLEKLERAARSGGAPTSHVPAPPPASGHDPAPVPGARSVPEAHAVPAPAPSGGTSPAAEARRALGAVTKKAPPPAPRVAAPPPAPPALAPVPAPSPAPAPAAIGDLPSREALTAAWGDAVLKTLRPRVKGLFGSGRFVGVEEGVATFGFEGEPLRDMAEEVRPEVEAALGAHFGRAVPLRLVVTAPGADSVAVAMAAVRDEEEPPDLGSLSNAPPDNRGPLDHLSAAFPGAEVIDDGQS